MIDCIFCRIAAGELGADILHQDSEVVAFRDIHPAAPTHILVIPRRHIVDLLAGEAEDAALWQAMVGTIRRLAATEGVAVDGFRIVINTGARAGQTIHHLHLHLLGGRDFTGF